MVVTSGTAALIASASGGEPSLVNTPGRSVKPCTSSTGVVVPSFKVSGAPGHGEALEKGPCVLAVADGEGLEKALCVLPAAGRAAVHASAAVTTVMMSQPRRLTAMRLMTASWCRAIAIGWPHAQARTANGQDWARSPWHPRSRAALRAHG